MYDVKSKRNWNLNVLSSPSPILSRAYIRNKQKQFNLGLAARTDTALKTRHHHDQTCYNLYLTDTHASYISRSHQEKQAIEQT